eukprot:6889458-Pyramimonas_sp.AAC.1
MPRRVVPLRVLPCGLRCRCGGPMAMGQFPMAVGHPASLPLLRPCQILIVTLPLLCKYLAHNILALV